MRKPGAETENIGRLLAEDNREKRRARGGQFVGKKSPRVLVLPSFMETGRGPPWRAIAPTLVWVNIVTGEVYVNRWPNDRLAETRFGVSHDQARAQADVIAQMETGSKKAAKAPQPEVKPWREQAEAVKASAAPGPPRDGNGR